MDPNSIGPLQLNQLSAFNRFYDSSIFQITYKI